MTQRQHEILGRVIEEHVETGQPVGSRSLVERAGMPVSASTVRAELAELEARCLLTHPHTSAGRVPTESGYRLYAQGLLEHAERPAPFGLDLSATRREIDGALEATTEMLSRVTRLLALVSAPSLETTTIRHVEVLVLQPQVVMAVLITSTGGVTKRIFAFEQSVDLGLTGWAHAYLNERVAGLQLGTHLIRQRFDDPGLTTAERDFLEALRPAFTDLVREQAHRVHVGGAASLLGEARADELETCHRLLEVLDRRASLLELADETLDRRNAVVRVGGELGDSSLRDVSLVVAGYGLANRTLGAVGLLGPVRMDYEKAIRSVRAAAWELSRFVEEVYEEN
ncbi:MAG: heat-inducible transcription repressor HrcA [Actinobacteria bacterium]|nr:heat-inducible transcription repressor HrcA [Actinomycetota bacterium]